MITFPKIKAASYAISRRLQGYHLLQNPSGTPQIEVNMIKENFYGTTPCWDDVFHISRLKKTFSKEGSHAEKRFLMSKHYMDVNTMQMTKPRKKDIHYIVRKDGAYAVMKGREDLAWETIEKSKVPKLSNKRKRSFEGDSEFKKMYATKKQAQRDRGYYKKHYSLLTKILSFGMYERIAHPTENRPNFFKVLYKNLTNNLNVNKEQKYDLRINYKHLV